MTQTSEKLVRPDVVGPPIPPEAPTPEVEPSLPQTGPDVLVRPGPEVTHVATAGNSANFRRARMSETVGDFLVERLHAWGVRRVFGYPGDGINGVFGALNRARDKIAFVQARHEEMAAFMASAYAKFSGELGVCLSTSGPGASHLITGLYDANSTTCRCWRSPASRRARRSAATISRKWIWSLFKDVAGAFVQQAATPAQVRHLIDRAVRIAIGERRVTALVLPNDLQEMQL